MQRFYAFIAVVFMMYFCGVSVFTYGTEWHFSPRGIPVSLLSEDGETYKNGQPIDDITKGLIRSGREETCKGVLWGWIVMMMAVVAFNVRSLKRVWTRFQLTQQLLDRAIALQNEGRWEEANELFDTGEKLLKEMMRSNRHKR